MKPIRQYQEQQRIDFNPQNLDSMIGYFVKEKIDFDVFLPSIGKNLQRPLVWTLEQKRELIWSVFIGRHIPAVSLMVTRQDVWQVIDGKQRLSTIISFIQDGFSIEIEGQEYKYSQLPEDWQSAYRWKALNMKVAYENGPSFTDKQKIQWFKFINFAGTPQDKEHMESLNNKNAQ